MGAVLSRVRRTGQTVRGRSAVLSGLVVLVVLAIGMVAILFFYRSALQSNLDTTLRQQATDRAELVRDGTDPTSLVSALRDESAVWIGRPDGTEIAAGGALIFTGSPLPDDLIAMPLDPGTSVARRFDAEVLEVHDSPPESSAGTEQELEVESLPVGIAASSDGTVIVVSAAEAEVVMSSLGPLARIFAIALPIAVLGAALLAWNTAGRALQPVEQIRRRSAEITGSNLSDRVPEPATDDEVGELAVTMNAMLDRLESHQRMRRRFTADASHELKSPIANLKVMLETADADQLDWPSLRTRALGETDRLTELLDSLLFLSERDEATPRPRAKTLVNLDDLLFDEAELIASMGSVRVDISSVEPAAILGDRLDLQRLVRNLSDNAARHAETTVWFATSDDGDQTIVDIADDGPGIALNDRERVFDRFARLDDARDRASGGTGLGLAIARQVAREHGGDIEVFDRDGGGTLMRVALPSGDDPLAS